MISIAKHIGKSVGVQLGANLNLPPALETSDGDVFYLTTDDGTIIDFSEEGNAD